ncbi:MAG: hypothetical protein S4CHLAM81_14450 [Chlamydiales bacterium]|nr:hypothetical protein [Chlamydiales bacterium]MCH9636217.1 hypothetical protein [Chlamydiales bacterium]
MDLKELVGFSIVVFITLNLVFLIPFSMAKGFWTIGLKGKAENFKSFYLACLAITTSFLMLLLLIRIYVWTWTL